MFLEVIQYIKLIHTVQNVRNYRFLTPTRNMSYLRFGIGKTAKPLHPMFHWFLNKTNISVGRQVWAVHRSRNGSIIKKRRQTLS